MTPVAVFYVLLILALATVWVWIMFPTQWPGLYRRSRFSLIIGTLVLMLLLSPLLSLLVTGAIFWRGYQLDLWTFGQAWRREDVQVLFLFFWLGSNLAYFHFQMRLGRKKARRHFSEGNLELQEAIRKQGVPAELMGWVGLIFWISLFSMGGHLTQAIQALFRQV